MPCLSYCQYLVFNWNNLFLLFQTYYRLLGFNVIQYSEATLMKVS